MATQKKTGSSTRSKQTDGQTRTRSAASGSGRARSTSSAQSSRTTARKTNSSGTRSLGSARSASGSGRNTTRSTNNRSNTRNTQTRQSSAASTGQARSRATQKQNNQRRLNAGISQEAFFLVCAVLLLILFLCILFGSRFGAVGEALHKGIVGLLGISAYLFCILGLTLLLLALFSDRLRLHPLKIVCMVALILAIGVFMHIVAGPQGTSPEETYKNAKWYMGGVLGGIIGNQLVAWIGKAGAILLQIGLMIACIVVITERSALRVTARAWKTTREATKSASRSMKEKLQQMEARRREEEIDALSSMEITMPVDPDPDPVPDTSQYIRNIKEYKPVSHYDDSISDEVPEFLKRKPVRLSTEPVQGGADAKRPIHDGPIDIPIISYNEYSQKLQNQRDAAALRDSGAPALSINPVQDSAAEASEPDTSKDGFDWSVLGGKPSFGEQESLSDWQTPAADTTGTPAKPARGENAVAKAAPVTKQEQEQVNEGIQQSLYASQAEQKVYVFPSIDLLDRARGDASGRQEQLYQNAHKLEQALLSFGVEATVTQVNQGPSVTRYELIPRQGVKVSRIVNLADDIALNLAAPSIRIEAPIPGKSAVGIEVPNKTPAMVTLREVIESDVFRKFPSKLAFSLGKTIDGELKVADIARMPHLLIAGTTGSGKSVCINSLLISLLYKADPKDVKMILIDPKVVELSIYNGIPHLLTPVVNDPKKAAAVLNWAVQEMTNRYKAFADNNVRDIRGYNEAVRDRAREGELMEAMPQIVIVIDELADLMMVAGKEVETAICRLAQMARAAGMHLVIATQRPSVDVITGLIKANIPSRLAFAVSSGVDSKTILDTVGAEKLLGRGDMLFWPIGDSKATRIQGTFVSDHEVERVVQAVKEQELQTSFSEEIMRKMESSGGEGGQTAGSDDDNDELLPEAIDFVLESQKASISLLQRKFRIGFNRAARLVDAIAERGLLGPDEGNNKGRKVLMTKDEYYNSNSEDQI